MARNAWWGAQLTCGDRSKDLLAHLFTNKERKRGKEVRPGY